MTKAEFFAKLAELYAVGNASDSDGEAREDWTAPMMAGNGFCRKIDEAMREMVNVGVITDDERDAFYNNL